MVDIPNYYERAIALLASQFQIRNPDGSKTTLQHVIAALISEGQEINTQEVNLQTDRYLNTAVGAQLDALGEIIGLPRIAGQSDESYREDLQFQIFINQSHGTPEEVIAILKFLTDATKIWYAEVYPAAYQMTTNGLIFPENPSDLVPAIQAVSPAGVHFIAVTATYNTNAFSFSTDPFNEQLYVAPNIADPTEAHPLQVNPGSGAENFFVNRGQVSDPDFGGGFAEALGVYPNYTIDTTGAGQLPEAIQA